MTTRYTRNRQTFRISTTGTVAAALLGFGILFTNATVGPILRLLVAVILAGVVVGLLAVALDESWLGALMPFLYGAGAATIGLVEFGHDGIFLLAIAIALAGGVLVTGSAMYRFKIKWVAPLSALLGAGVASLALYLL